MEILSVYRFFVLWIVDAIFSYTNLVPILIYRLTGMLFATLEALVMESNPQNRQQYHA